MTLCNKPRKPKNEVLIDSYSILCRSIDSANSFFDAFNKIRKSRKAKGTPTDHEQDLLRAALLFSAAGLDSMAKQLVRDTLEVVNKTELGSFQEFSKYVQGRMMRGMNLDVKYVTEALLSDNPQQHFREELIREITSNSLQSKDQLLSVASYFAIPADEIVGGAKGELAKLMTKLKDVFDTRNQIAHEMDVLLGQRNRSRRPRNYETMHDYTSFILHVSCNFFNSVAKRI